MTETMFDRLPEEKKHRILRAAFHEFTEKPYELASTNTIAREAGISKGSLFHYFGSKEELYEYLVDTGITIIEEAVYQPIRKDLDFIEFIREAVQAELQFLQSFPDLKHFFLRLHESSALLNASYQERYQAAYAKFYETCLQLAKQEPFRPDLPYEQCLKVAFWIMEGAANEYVRAGGRLDDDAALIDFTENTLSLIQTLLYQKEF